MKKAHIICIIDNSASMSLSARDVISSFNTFVENQSEERGDAFLSVVLFNKYTNNLHIKEDIKSISKMTPSEYRCGGNTAMYDAIGSALESNNDDDVFVIIQTDGEENASSSYNSSSVTKLIEEKKKKGWKFLFLGADIDVKRAAGKIGLENDAVEFNKNSKGIEVAFGMMSGKTSQFRSSLDTVKLYPKSYKVV